MENLPVWIQVVGLVFGSILSGGIATLLLTRLFSRRDARQKVHETNQTAKIAADSRLESQFREDLLNRVKSLESDYKELDHRERETAIENKGLTTENKHLKNQNAEQADQIEKLRQENVDLRGQLNTVRVQLETLKQELNSTVNEVHMLKATLNRFGDPAIEIEKEVLRRLGSVAHISNLSHTIVVVDDHADMLELMKQLFEDAGLICVIFSKAAEALEWLRHFHASVVITDLAIDQDIDGLTFIEKLRGHERRNRKLSAHIIIYTGYDVNEGIQQDMIDFSIEAFLKKGNITPQDLVEIVKNLVFSTTEKRLS